MLSRNKPFKLVATVALATTREAAAIAAWILGDGSSTAAGGDDSKNEQNSWVDWEHLRKLFSLPRPPQGRRAKSAKFLARRDEMWEDEGEGDSLPATAAVPEDLLAGIGIADTGEVDARPGITGAGVEGVGTGVEGQGPQSSFLQVDEGEAATVPAPADQSPSSPVGAGVGASAAKPSLQFPTPHNMLKLIPTQESHAGAQEQDGQAGSADHSALQVQQADNVAVAGGTREVGANLKEVPSLQFPTPHNMMKLIPDGVEAPTVVQLPADDKKDDSHQSFLKLEETSDRRTVPVVERVGGGEALSLLQGQEERRVGGKQEHIKQAEGGHDEVPEVHERKGKTQNRLTENASPGISGSLGDLHTSERDDLQIANHLQSSQTTTSGPSFTQTGSTGFRQHRLRRANSDVGPWTEAMKVNEQEAEEMRRDALHDYVLDKYPPPDVEVVAQTSTFALWSIFNRNSVQEPKQIIYRTQEGDEISADKVTIISIRKCYIVDFRIGAGIEHLYVTFTPAAAVTEGRSLLAEDKVRKVVVAEFEGGGWSVHNPDSFPQSWPVVYESPICLQSGMLDSATEEFEKLLEETRKDDLRNLGLTAFQKRMLRVQIDEYNRKNEELRALEKKKEPTISSWLPEWVKTSPEISDQMLNKARQARDKAKWSVWWFLNKGSDSFNKKLHEIVDRDEVDWDSSRLLLATNLNEDNGSGRVNPDKVTDVVQQLGEKLEYGKSRRDSESHYGIFSKNCQHFVNELLKVWRTGDEMLNVDQQTRHFTQLRGPLHLWPQLSGGGQTSADSSGVHSLDEQFASRVWNKGGEKLKYHRCALKTKRLPVVQRQIAVALQKLKDGSESLSLALNIDEERTKNASWLRDQEVKNQEAEAAAEPQQAQAWSSSFSRSWSLLSPTSSEMQDDCGTKGHIEKDPGDAEVLNSLPPSRIYLARDSFDRVLEARRHVKCLKMERKRLHEYIESSCKQEHQASKKQATP
ncbi:unnamed protein product [Amoebophrya sp. A120]|nr:unnamed protein product [Amoebophrya sp. A120]|eukprot:GSA120T00009948001.1